MNTSAVLTGIGIWGLLGLSPAYSQAPAKIGEIVQRASGQDMEGLLELSQQIQKAAADPAQMQELLSLLPNAQPEAKLALAKALLELDESEKAVEPLLALLESKEETLSLAAARFLSDSQYLRNKSLEEKLLQKMSAGSLEPRVRLELASTLYRIGSGDARAAARSELRAFLKSEEPALRHWGVLSLAEIGDLEFVRPELLRLAEQPNSEGRLARAFLTREDLERLYERKIKNLEEYYRKNPTAAPEKGKSLEPGNVLLLDEVIKHIQHAHIRGEMFNREELVSGAAKGMLNLLDPYSTYFTGDEYKRFVFDINQDYGGIGAFVRNINNVFTIVRPIYSGPAYRVGLRSDDKIFAVDGWETAGHDEDEIIKRLKGKPGTPVKIQVYRAGWSEAKEYEIAREQINVPVLQHEMFPGGIGYVELISFSRDANRELQAAVKGLQAQGMKGLILDLRNDPGGLLESAVEVCENLLPANSLVVYTDSRIDGRADYRTERSRKDAWTFPMIVLVNDRSASASEIVAGALQFHQRATIIGEQTYGKGTVQTFFPVRSLPDEPYLDENQNGRFDDWEKHTDVNQNGKFDYGPRIKMTIARYFFPNGQSINSDTDKAGRVKTKGGVVPDVEVKFQDTDRFKFEELERVLTLKSAKDPKLDLFREYVQKHFSESGPARELFLQLAEGDGKDFAKYPDFEEFYRSLNTPLDRNEIRRWLRLRIREAVSDARGKVFPGERFLGDYQEDSQLQKAISVLLDKLGLDAKQIPEYRTAFVREDDSTARKSKDG